MILFLELLLLFSYLYFLFESLLKKNNKITSAPRGVAILALLESLEKVAINL